MAGFVGNPLPVFIDFWGIICPAVLHHTHVRNLQQSFSMRSRHPLPAFGKKGQGMS